IVKSAAPTETSRCVRSPASRSRNSRSSPIAPPSTAARTTRRTMSSEESSGKDGLHGALLRLGDRLDPCGGQVEHLVELVAGVALALRGRLHLDQPPVAAHDDVEVDLCARVLRVVEVEQRRAVDNSEGNAGDRVRERLAEPEAIERPAGSDVGAGDRRAAGSAVGLEDVAVDPECPLAESAEVGDRAERAADQALDLDGAPLLLARARLALCALARGSREEPVLRGHPALALAHQPAGNSFGDRRRAEDARLACGDQRRAVRLLEVVHLDLERAELIGLPAVGPHAGVASSSASSTLPTPSSGSWRKRWPSSRKRPVSPVVRNR